ncbi:MAG: diphosphate--fructose-6-phosphate 1-phosphotransferase [Chlamydiales bacterium]
MPLPSDLSPLQRHRLEYKPELPSILKHLKSLQAIPLDGGLELSVDESIKPLFPYTASQPLLTFETGALKSHQPLNVGVFFSGGQAPGGHNVIAGLFDALRQLNPSNRLFGFLDGPDGMIKNRTVELTEEMINGYRNQGGFDLIGSGRTKIEKPEQFEAVTENLKSLGLDGLVVIGGDDSNTNAAVLAEHFKQRGLPVSVVGVPKTIDGDLKNEYVELSFGFDTACKVYSETIGNLAKDALSAKKYYFFVKLMGRSASHVTLACALKTQVNLALIGEEVSAGNQTLHELVDQITDLICARSEVGKNYGVILIPEGIIEFIAEFKLMIQELNLLFSQEGKIDLTALSSHSAACYHQLPDEIQRQLLLDRDPHGNIQVSKIETERLFITLVEKELQRRRTEGKYAGTFNPQPLFYGYEGRSGLPSNFDCQYCYALGHTAALLVNARATGYMGCIRHLSQSVKKWEIQAVPLTRMLHMERRKGKDTPVIQKGLVDLNGAFFGLYKKMRNNWMMNDHYCCPGPIQFDGPPELTEGQ